MIVHAPVANSLVANFQSGLPSIPVLDLKAVTRIDSNMGESFLVEKIRHAMDIINGQIMDVSLPLNAAKERFYVRAVLHEAAALISEDNADYDSTSTGQDRAEIISNKAQRLRRMVNHSIADIKGHSRNRVRLV